MRLLAMAGPNDIVPSQLKEPVFAGLWSFKMQPDAAASPQIPRTLHVVDNTDWLKAAAIVLVTIDHGGYFFVDNPDWWHAFGRLAAPVFFFLLGYAHTRTVPFLWIWVGVVLTLLNSWNANWSWVAPNILLSFVLIRLARPFVQTLLENYGWIAFAVILCVLIAVHPIASNIVDYGAEGWLWAFFGLCQRRYVDGKSDADRDGIAENSKSLELEKSKKPELMHILSCIVAAVFYIWQEQNEFSFPKIPFAVFILGVGVLSFALCMFVRKPSQFQPSESVAGMLHFIGRHTLEIYAIQLASFELIVKLVPDLVR